MRLRLMAEELSDLPMAAIDHAVMMWRRGDTKHLSSYQQESVRIGVFFPKPAELRDIAQFFLRKQRQEQRQRELDDEYAAQERHRTENPEQYMSVASIVAEVAEKKKLDLVQAATAKAALKCSNCGVALPVQKPSLATLTPAELRLMADTREKQLSQAQDEQQVSEQAEETL